MFEFFKAEKGNLGLSKEHLNILSCFLNPSKMVKQEEAPNPQHVTAELLEYTKEGEIRSKQPSKNLVKRDLLWELFDPDNGNLDPSDIDLRHALANMIAVMFSLPSRSTHLWYHMFIPGDLKNSYLTGFMVCLDI